MVNEGVRIGIELARNKIRFIEAESWNGRLNITSVQQSDLPTQFDFTTIGDPGMISRFSETIDQACTGFDPQHRQARLCIDRRLVIKKTFAVDKDMAEADIRQHIEWELEQLLTAPRDEFNVGYEHTVLNLGRNDVVVFVAVRKALIHYLQEIFKKSRLELESVDLDLFASIRALRYAHGDVVHGTTALLEFNRSGIGITLLHDGGYVLSDELPAVINEKDYTTLPSAEVAVPLQAELHKLLQNIKDNLGILTLNRIVLAGECTDKALMSDLDHLFPRVPIIFAEPFNNSYRQLNIESQRVIDTYGQNFLSCLGMVL